MWSKCLGPNQEDNKSKNLKTPELDSRNRIGTVNYETNKTITKMILYGNNLPYLLGEEGALHVGKMLAKNDALEEFRISA